MVIPNLPTDSLYKFCFVGGLFMFFMSYYALIVKVENYDELSYKIDIEQLKLEVQMKSLKESYEMLAPMFDAIENSDQENYVISKSDELEKRYEQLKIKETELEIQSEFFSNETKRIINLKIITYILMGVGILTASLSGWKWYAKIQKYHDYILKRKYENLKSSVQPIK